MQQRTRVTRGERTLLNVGSQIRPFREFFSNVWIPQRRANANVSRRRPFIDYRRIYVVSYLYRSESTWRLTSAPWCIVVVRGKCSQNSLYSNEILSSITNVDDKIYNCIYSFFLSWHFRISGLILFFFQVASKYFVIHIININCY